MLFATDDYKTALKTALLAKREQLPKRYTFQNLAKACGVQKTYLSKVFRDDTPLSRDQVFLGCEFLDFTAAETDFVLLLHDFARTSVTKRRRTLLAEIRAVQAAQLKTERHISARPAQISEPEMASYFLDPRAQLVHMMLTVDRFRSDLGLLCRQIGLGEADLAKIMALLGRVGLVANDAGKVRLTADELHLPADSPVFAAYRTLMRQQAIGRMQARDRDDDYFFTVIFSADTRVQAQIRAKFLALLKEAEGAVRGAPKEDVFQMTFDLFRWT